jgi:hypothetical protein
MQQKDGDENRTPGCQSKGEKAIVLRGDTLGAFKMMME